MFIIKKHAAVVVELCAPRAHPLYFILLYSYTRIRLELCKVLKNASVA